MQNKEDICIWSEIPFYELVTSDRHTASIIQPNERIYYHHCYARVTHHFEQ